MNSIQFTSWFRGGSKKYLMLAVPFSGSNVPKRSFHSEIYLSKLLLSPKLCTSKNNLYVKNLDSRYLRKSSKFIWEELFWSCFANQDQEDLETLTYKTTRTSWTFNNEEPLWLGHTSHKDGTGWMLGHMYETHMYCMQILQMKMGSNAVWHFVWLWSQGLYFSHRI